MTALAPDAAVLSRPAPARTLRPFLPPPIESLGLDGDGESVLRQQLRRSFDAGYRKGLAEGAAQAHAEGHAAGLAAGLEQARAAAGEAAERSRREGVAALNQALAGLAARRTQDIAALDRACRETLSAAVGLLAPVLASAGLRDELEAMLAEAAARRGAETVTLRAHPETLAALPEAERPAGIVLLPDGSMRKDMAEASWASGGLLFSAEALADRALAILRPPAAAAAGAEDEPAGAAEPPPALPLAAPDPVQPPSEETLP